ncbi:MAG: HAD family phosphatase [Cyclobacteriaceae bacterium]
MKNLKAILFDFDGTLVDSEKFHFDCWNEVLVEFNVQLEYEYYLDHFAGIPTTQNAIHLTKAYDLNTSPDELVKMREDFALIKLDELEVELMPYVEEILNITEAKYRMGIVTGSPRHDVDKTLGKLGWENRFECIITRDDVSNSKPNPESYLKALVQMNLSSDECIVFEDTENGVKSAKAAGLRCCAVQSRLNYQPRLQQADMVHQNMKKAFEALEL